jgi:DNA-binding transcriptional regulator YiaG
MRLDRLCYNYSMTGIEIRGIRRALGLRQEDFAKKLGVHQTTVARWETDRIEPSPEALARIEELRKVKTK